MSQRAGKQNRTLLLFYILAGYVFASYLWWGYLLIDRNIELYNVSNDYNKLQWDISANIKSNWIDYQNTEQYKLITAKYKRQQYMIMGEGAVFIFILVLGIIQIRKAVMQEVSLAKQQKNFMLSITHELKSPLASVKLGLQTLNREGISKDNFEKIHSNSLDDVDRLEILMNNILLAAKIDSRQYTVGKEEFDLSKIVSDAIEKLIIMHGAKRQFTTKIEAGISFEGDPVGLTSVVTNLVENAVKYSDPGEHIKIELEKTNNNIFITVADTGQGIAERERENVFRKFYRVGNEETRSAKGTGLGLYIVKQIVEQHEGKISVIDNKPQGSVFRVEMPLKTIR